MAHPDAYYEMANSRSPNSRQPQVQTLHRQTSRQFEQYAPANAGLYTAEDHAARYDTARYDTARVGTRSVSYGFDNATAQTWNPQSFGSVNNMGSLPGRGVKGVARQRSALPTTWLDSTSLPGVNLGMGGLPLGPQPLGDTRSDDDELIPTAIVIKNIPFAVKKEQLVQLMTDLDLPLPYAFNYHFDNGVFRGLAFANFTTAEETATVINILNHFELQGRKLRVEYKKMLPLAERERIEREKRERRGQLEEQHRPGVGGPQQLQHQSSMQSLLPSLSPRPTSSSAQTPKQEDLEIDLNNPQTLQFYSQLLLFRDDVTREALIFPPTLSPSQRRIVHTLAHHMSLAHISRGTGEGRQVQVFRHSHQIQNISPPSIPTVIPVESQQRRTLARATTMDFSETRSADGGVGIYSTIGRQGGLLDVPNSPSGKDAQSRTNLRAAKSFADLRSYTPSPVPTSASFPIHLSQNVVKYQQQQQQGGEYTNGSSTTPSLTSTGSNNMNSINESLLVNGLAGVSLGSSLNISSNSLRGDPRDARGLLGDGGMHGAIGGLSPSQTTSTRNFSMAYDEQRDRGSQILPSRQPRGPDSERSVGFGRGSVRQANLQGRQNNTDLDGQQHPQQQSVEITVE
ncbi:hypothetical protein H072_1528 [Dactylellina haptotyla CBS 200.50]|uniref:R3H domain-containing protein n=1 Tax=Dactylellina haptotyla (strain CBS 200.50) TaxID=1284197 RepID=S8ANQ9_DACHA|nr:hypothetical protein H072_1528 [Dactylellina haptotyla CBS 200.50]